MPIRKTYLLIGVIFSCLYARSQSSFIHINSQKLDTSATRFYGESLKALAKTSFIDHNSQINYNPAISFDGETDYLEIDKPVPDLSQLTVFTIFKPENDSISEGEVWGIHGEETTLGLTTKKTFNNSKTAYYQGVGKGKAVLHTFMQLHRSGRAYPNLKTFLSLGVINKDSASIHFKGSIAEVIAYKKRLRGNSRLKMESSLAIKYGITLYSGENYISSNKKVIWDAEKHNVYSNNIAGIGRDDDMNLYQKQSSSSNEDEFLVLSTGAKMTSNKKNLSELNNRNFLVWGDNDEDLNLEASTAEKKPALLNRKWLIKATGSKAKEITTQLQVNANLLFDGLKAKDDYLLVVDQSGNGDFLPENTKYIAVSSLTPEGILVFENLQWDTDNSGEDVFTFIFKKPLVAELSSVQPVICPNTLTNLNYMIDGGIPPYQYNLVGDTGYSRQWNDSEDQEINAILTDIPPGIYTLTVTDFLGHTANTNYKIEETAPVTIDLGADKTLMFEQSLVLQAQISQPEKIISFEWIGDNGYSATDASAVISQPGNYTLKVTTDAGCEYTDSVYINESFVKEFELYPNPSPDGKYNIAVELASRQNIKVSVYNVLGVLISDFEIKNKQKAVIKAKSIRQSGIYDVILQTPEEIVSKKLIVE